MTDISLTNGSQATVPHAPEAPGQGLVALLAAGAGLSVASIYYAQPLLGVVAADLQAPPWLAGWIPTATQLGYALGLLLLGPLADRHDRRRVIAAKAAALTLALLLAAVAPSVGMLLVASAVVGVTATVAQDFVPAAAALAPAHRRGKLVGQVMTGLLLGILLSRVLSGMLADQFGWRTVFVLAAASVAAIGAAAWKRLPAFPADAGLAYGALLRSLATLWQRHPALRRAAVAQGLLGLGFSAFWSTLAVLLHGAPFHLGSAAAGAFGLAGAAGALAAPSAGR
ncbi:MAG: MFS transporter, partial [Comamonadaceae bacterium]